MRQSVFANMFLALAESLSAENAGRIAAMQSAEGNIEERLDELTQEFFRQRQAKITSELLDITSGFRAQSG